MHPVGFIDVLGVQIDDEHTGNATVPNEIGDFENTICRLLVVPTVHENDAVPDCGQDAPVLGQFVVEHEFGR